MTGRSVRLHWMPSPPTPIGNRTGLYGTIKASKKTTLNSAFFTEMKAGRIRFVFVYLSWGFEELKRYLNDHISVHFRALLRGKKLQILNILYLDVFWLECVGVRFVDLGFTPLFAPKTLRPTYKIVLQWLDSKWKQIFNPKSLVPEIPRHYVLVFTKRSQKMFPLYVEIQSKVLPPRFPHPVGHIEKTALHLCPHQFGFKLDRNFDSSWLRKLAIYVRAELGTCKGGFLVWSSRFAKKIQTIWWIHDNAYVLAPVQRPQEGRCRHNNALVTRLQGLRLRGVPSSNSKAHFGCVLFIYMLVLGLG